MFASPWLQSILNQSKYAVMIADPAFHVIKWNTACELLLEQKTVAITGRKVFEIVHQLACNTDDIDLRLQQVAEKGAYEEDMLLTRPNGEFLKLSCYAHKLPETGRISALVVVIRELEEQVNDNLQKESIFHSYLENSLSPSWICDEDGTTLFMNKTARDVWGLDNGYRLKHIHELFLPEIADEFLASDKQVLENGQPIAFVVPFIRKNGCTGYYMLHKFLLPQHKGKKLIAGQAIDITEEINIREELKKSNERFSYVSKAISDCIWDWDMETGQIYRSEALMALTGYTEENIQNTLDWWMDNVHATDRRSLKNKLENFIKHGKPYCDAEYRFRCANNKYKHFLDKGYIIYHNGKPVRAIGVVHDITEKKTLQGKLLRQKVQKQKDLSRAIIAAQEHVSNELSKELHDNANQLLVAACIMLKCAQNEVGGSKQEYLTKGKDYVRHAIDEIRKISKSLNTSIIGDMGLIGPVRNIIHNMELNHPVKMQFDCDEMLEQQLYDEQKLMLYRIIQEQSNNIIKYAEASEVSIEIKRKANSLQLIIQDNGIGFDIKKVKRGIGLSNIRNRVESFSGSLNIISSPQSGCRLEINVPFREKRLSAARK